MKSIIGVVLFLLVLIAHGGEVADYHSKLSNRSLDSPASRSHEEVASTNHGITEIGIERAEYLNGNGSYSFVAKSDGTFRYKAVRRGERNGEFTGSISTEQFDCLAQFIEDSGYMELDDSYSRLARDSPEVFTMVVKNGKTKTIRNYANSGPSKLWATEQLIDSLMEKADWPPEVPPEKLPAVTKYDHDPSLRNVYLEMFKKGYLDALDRRERLPVYGPTNNSDKAKLFGYLDGAAKGRTDQKSEAGTNP